MVEILSAFVLVQIRRNRFQHQYCRPNYFDAGKCLEKMMLHLGNPLYYLAYRTQQGSAYSRQNLITSANVRQNNSDLHKNCSKEFMGKLSKKNERRFEPQLDLWSYSLVEISKV